MEKEVDAGDALELDEGDELESGPIEVVEGEGSYYIEKESPLKVM